MERFISFNNIYSGIKGLSSASKDLAKLSSSLRIANYVLFALLVITAVLIISLVVVHVKKLKIDCNDLKFAIITSACSCICALIIICSFKDDYLSYKEKYNEKSDYVTSLTQKNNVDADSLVANVEYLLSVYDEYSSKYENLESNVDGNYMGKTLNFDTSIRIFRLALDF